ncbi:hypothetical protein SM139_2780 [Stenotrophomonas maltophilia]|nr:hypothetical protein SM139_2780 [Stenotrophomonas maltophilia]
MTSCRCPYGVLTITLAGAVDTQRRGRFVLTVRGSTLSIEHIIGGVMHERHAMRRTPACDHARRLRVGRKRSFHVLLGTINGGIGRSIHHHRRLKTVQQRRQTDGLAEISGFAGAAIGQDTAAGGRDHLAERCQRAQQLLADLAVGAEQQNGHGL